MGAEPRFTTNRNRADGVEYLHVEHPAADCPIDEQEPLQTVDEMTAETMVLRGDVRLCPSCKPAV